MPLQQHFLMSLLASVQWSPLPFCAGSQQQESIVFPVRLQTSRSAALMPVVRMAAVSKVRKVCFMRPPDDFSEGYHGPVGIQTDWRVEPLLFFRPGKIE